MTHTWSVAGAAGLYALAGCLSALALARAGHPKSTVAAAVVTWPLLVGLLMSPSEPAAIGPYSHHIDATLRHTLAALATVPGADLSTELKALQSALHLADQRIQVVDKILAHELGGAEARVQDRAGRVNADRLRAARAAAADELLAVLAGLSEVRMQVGLMALSELSLGDATAVRDRLGELRARVSAMEELA
jgi:hypothetical protein